MGVAVFAYSAALLLECGAYCAALRFVPGSALIVGKGANLIDRSAGPRAARGKAARRQGGKAARWHHVADVLGSVRQALF